MGNQCSKTVIPTCVCYIFLNEYTLKTCYTGTKLISFQQELKLLHLCCIVTIDIT